MSLVKPSGNSSVQIERRPSINSTVHQALKPKKLFDTQRLHSSIDQRPLSKKDRLRSSADSGFQKALQKYGSKAHPLRKKKLRLDLAGSFDGRDNLRPVTKPRSVSVHDKPDLGLKSSRNRDLVTIFEKGSKKNFI